MYYKKAESKEGGKVVKFGTFWDNDENGGDCTVFIVCITILLILWVGEPDLIDALISIIMK